MIKLRVWFVCTDEKGATGNALHHIIIDKIKYVINLYQKDYVFSSIQLLNDVEAIIKEKGYANFYIKEIDLICE